MKAKLLLLTGWNLLLVPGLWADIIDVGTAESAQAALARAKAGDEIVLADGIYENCILFVGDSRPTPELTAEEMTREDLKVANPPPLPAPEFTLPLKEDELPASALGTAANPIKFRARNPGKAIFTGASAIRIKGRHLIVEGFTFDQAWRDGPIVAFSFAENCRLTQCAFIECGTPEYTWGRSIDVTNRSRHIRVDHCLMKGNLSIGMGISIKPYDYDSSHVQFDHNYFKDIIARSRNGQESIQLGQGGVPGKFVPFDRGTFAVVEFNLLENASGDAEIFSHKAGDNIYRGNTFRDCKGELCLRGGPRARVEGNYFLGNGIRVHGDEHVIINNYFANCASALNIPSGSVLTKYPGSKNCVFAHNTVVNARTAINIGWGMDKEERIPIKDNTFANNLILIQKGVAIKDALSENTAWMGNMVFGGGSKTEPTAPAVEGIRVIDPKLSPGENGVYSLAADSPAINGGNVTSGVSIDIEGQDRDGKPDIGCDEITSGNRKYKILSPADVGPEWMRGDLSSLTRIPAPKPIPKAIN